MGDSAKISAYSARVSVTPIQWTTHPARARPIAAVCAVAAMSVMGVAVSQLAGEWLWGALASLALFLSLSRFFLPTRYRIDNEGASVIYPLSTSRLQWSEVGFIQCTATRARIARSNSRRELHRALALDFATLDAVAVAQLRVFVASRTKPEVWQ